MNYSKQTKAQLLTVIENKDAALQVYVDDNNIQAYKERESFLLAALFFTAAIGFAFWLSHDASHFGWYHEVIPQVFFILFYIMSNINNELLYEQCLEEVIEEATLTETIAKYSAEDLHLAAMNRFSDRGY